MGLDMYVFTTTTSLTQPVDFEGPENIEELHYWRKHPNLHGWMEALYFAKGGKDKDFNMSPVTLEAAELDVLAWLIALDRLPVTAGFFFGESDGSEREDDLEFIEKARKALAEGKTVFYLAWW
jgi:hypothetical protein